MQPIIRKFAADLSREVRKSPYRKKIASIVLLGSAARGEFIRGESDIDFIVVVRKSNDRKPVTKFVSRVLNKLNKKHNLQLEKTCTDRNDYHNEILKAIMRLESSVFFGIPFYTISMEDYDFFQNRIHNPKVWFIATFLGSLNQFLIAVRDTGKTIYGKNLLDMIDVKMTFFDKAKVFAEQMLVMLAGLLVLPFSGKLAMKHFVKASLYQEEFDLLFLHKHLHGYIKDKDIFASAFSGDRPLINHLKKSIKYRKNYKKINPSRSEAIKYMMSTLSFIMTTMRKTGI